MAEDESETTREEDLLTDLEALVDSPIARQPRPEQPGLRGRKRRRWPFAVAGLFVVAVSGAAWVWYGPLGGRVPLEIPVLKPSAAETTTLFFADPRWTKLVTETRQLQPGSDAVARMRALFEALAEGPRGEAAPVLPKGAGLRAAYVGKEGLAVLDLEPWPEEMDFGGASGELLAVFSLVHTMTQNVPNIRQVRILVGGAEQETLAGHVKISEPLHPEGQTGADAAQM